MSKRKVRPSAIRCARSFLFSVLVLSFCWEFIIFSFYRYCFFFFFLQLYENIVEKVVPLLYGFYLYGARRLINHSLINWFLIK